MKHISIAIIFVVLACDQQPAATSDVTTPLIELTYYAELEIHGIKYYDDMRTFNPPLMMSVSSEPTIIQMDGQPILAASYRTKEMTVDSLDGTLPSKQWVGNLIFLEKVDGQWQSIGDEDQSWAAEMTPIELISKERRITYDGRNDAGEYSFEIDYSYTVVKR
ncbi:MAG: hypothetical protein JXQ90_13575 [Cyclobacteriaceae bacterium]